MADERMTEDDALDLQAVNRMTVDATPPAPADEEAGRGAGRRWCGGPMRGRYEGRIALVTGAAAGLGRATARRLAAEGARVACLDLHADDAGLGPAGLALAGDVRDEAAVGEAVDRTLAWGGGLDLVVTAAGVASFGHTTDVPLAEWERMLAVNLTGTFLTARAALPHLGAARGALVTVSSLAGVRGYRYSAAYSAAKGGVVALTRALAVEYAPAGVRVTCVCPGSIDTGLTRNLAPVPAADPRLLAHGRALVDPPVSQPEEIAGAIAYLGSPEARFATGAVLRMDGGAGV
ncbi:SDR family NAD(P)-dependent oxidoreductase [Micromonospora sp. AMSO12t]|uniref:SDR family NAD(P)-dependent oxidoreductase n=1 Tax=Micromonospora sp. AMSO12t TaxID=2650410 RepID=UPI001CEDCF23|nr:SDR family NAD(P)-dependent oxidoreductase [Micromonospora sp. AMSO12t]